MADEIDADVIEEEFKNSVDQMTIDVMSALYKHRPNQRAVIETLCRIIGGTILQLPSSDHEKSRQIIARMIRHYSDVDSTFAVDMTDRMLPSSHN